MAARARATLRRRSAARRATRPSRAPHWRKYGLDYRRCARCATVYVSPRPDPELLDEYYRTSTNYEYWNTVVFPASEDGAARADLPPARRARSLALRRRTRDAGRRRRRLRDVLRGGRARLGAFERVIALEPEPHLAQTCRAKGLEVIEAPVERRRARRGVDVVTELRGHRAPVLAARVRRALRRAPAPGRAAASLTCPNVRGFDVEMLGERSATRRRRAPQLLPPGVAGRAARALRLRRRRGADARPPRRRAGAQDGARGERDRSDAVPAARADRRVGPPRRAVPGLPGRARPVLEHVARGMHGDELRLSDATPTSIPHWEDEAARYSDHVGDSRAAYHEGRLATADRLLERAGAARGRARRRLRLRRRRLRAPAGRRGLTVVPGLDPAEEHDRARARAGPGRRA